ncbi:ABC transporter substrate-binding protein [Deinococcus deserti]|uniref:Putative sugar ABC transporter, periplasmic component n=1 Tax=Deinococcus deserti (strain DSM 17065 / CIP 109153 / LMG 22923 / VCD115) TaxID=546414 RepID=C1D356_DEIDV|nr:ABC transporter substrate-binding protein [Deinococcus deserti]ACO47845.1 putative sugar ABC transporter, periplasmic component [Deinococcus deserti VCD115]
MKRPMTVLSLTAAIVTAQAGAATVTIDCGAGTGYDLCKEGVNRWAKKTGNTAKFFESPNNSTDHLGLIQQQLAAKSADIDVYLIDIVWPGLLADQLVDLKGKVPASELKQHFKGIVDANTVNGKLVAIPWFTDAGLLYYRTDLLKKYGYKAPPRTWAELRTMAQKIQAGERKTNKAFTGFVFQGRNGESLTCDALEWVASFGGGTIVDDSGKITINNPKAAQALDTAASWIRDITPAGVIAYDEEQSRGTFQSGNAAFMRNWPYAWALGQSEDSRVKGKIGVAALPAGPGGKPAATLGGWNLAVNTYSKNQAAAIDLIRYLTSPEEQKIRATAPGASFNPTVQALYKDPQVLKVNPFYSSLISVFTNAVARPSGPTKGKYNQVSQAFANAASSVLNRKATGQAAVAQLSTELSRIKGRGW